MSNEKAEEVLVSDPTTGEFKQVPKSEAGTIARPRLATVLPPAPEVSPRGLSRAIFEDETDSSTYNSTIELLGRHWYIHEMSGEWYQEYINAERAHAIKLQAMSARQKDAERDGEQVDIDSAFSESEEFTAEHVALFDRILERHVVDVTGSRSFTPGMTQRLIVSAKAKLCQGIVQKSRLGQDEADFSRRR